MTKPRIAIVIGSDRPTRFADKPTAWLMEKAEARDDFDVELLDLRDFDLPFFDQPASDMWMPTENAAARKWQEKLDEFDGFIFMVAEYNHSITGVLKNALDQAYLPMVRKPMTAFAYGSMGGARALEHLRTIAVELQMAPIRNAIHLGAADFFKVHPMGGDAPMSEVEEHLAPAAQATFDDLAWWARTLKEGRAAEKRAAA